MEASAFVCARARARAGNSSTSVKLRIRHLTTARVDVLWERALVQRNFQLWRHRYKSFREKKSKPFLGPAEAIREDGTIGLRLAFLATKSALYV